MRTEMGICPDAYRFSNGTVRELNHMDGTWADVEEAPGRADISPRRYQTVKKHHHPPRDFCPPYITPSRILPPPCVVKRYDEIGIDSVEKVYGMSLNNVKLLGILSHRVQETSLAIEMINNTRRPLSLNELFHTAPSIGNKFREILDQAYRKQLEDDLATINELQKYLYGKPEEDTDTSSEVTVESGTDSIDTTQGDSVLGDIVFQPTGDVSIEGEG